MIATLAIGTLGDACAADHSATPMDEATATGHRPTLQYDSKDKDDIWVVSNFITDKRLMATLADWRVWDDCPGIIGWNAGPSVGWWTGASRPRTVWEELAALIWSGQRRANGFVGLEYWCRVADPGEELGWHCDKDENQLMNSGKVVPPTMAAVMYAYPHQIRGGALEISHVRDCEDAEEGEGGEEEIEKEYSPTDSDQIRPLYNRLVVFDGRRQHRVRPWRSGKRYSFQVNVWHRNLSSGDIQIVTQ
jgi:hypothetical protein